MSLEALMVQAMVEQVHAGTEVLKGCRTFANHGPHVHIKGSDFGCSSNPWRGELFFLEFERGTDEHKFHCQAIILILAADNVALTRAAFHTFIIVRSNMWGFLRTSTANIRSTVNYSP